LTPAAPTWAEVEAFLAADGWRPIPNRGGGSQRHIFYEKVLPDGRVLQTHVSHSGGKAPSPGRFSSILRHQLEVSKTEFWECIRTGAPVDRPAPVDDGPVEHEAWVLAVLVRDLHMSAEEIEALTPEEAQQLVNDYWSRPTA
jgi:hypothetical protein